MTIKPPRAREDGMIEGTIVEVVGMELPPRGVVHGDDPMTHELKCWPSAFRPTIEGRKNFEFRKADREYRRGDSLMLREWAPEPKEYTGEEVTVKVTFVLHGPAFGIPEGFCVMSFDPVQTSAQDIGDARMMEAGLRIYEDGFAAGAASRDEEVDRIQKLVTAHHEVGVLRDFGWGDKCPVCQKRGVQ